jgi:hypothetical protein
MPLACGLDERLFKDALAVGRISAEIRERSLVMLLRGGRRMRNGVDVTVQRRDAARAEQGLKIVERRTTGKAQHQMEARKPMRANVFDRLIAAQSRQRHWRVEIVKHAQAARLALGKSRYGHRIWTVGGHDDNIRIAHLPRRERSHVLPIRIQHNMNAGLVLEIARAGVLVNVAFEEHDVMTVLRERLAQAAP